MSSLNRKVGSLVGLSLYGGTPSSQTSYATDIPNKLSFYKLTFSVGASSWWIDLRGSDFVVRAIHAAR